METVSVKLVVFKTAEEGLFCGYSPELTYFVNDKTSKNDVVQTVKRHLNQELCHRLRYKNLKIRGWEVSENSVKPPIFADEEIVSLAEQLYETKIIEPQIIVVNVELPETKNLW